MAEPRTRKVGRIKKDIISELPRNMKENILCFLPIQDAVRTSILSKKWRYCWTMMPHLIFDDRFALRMMDKLSQYDNEELMAHKFWIPFFSWKGIKQLILEDSELREVTAHNFSSLDLTHLRLSSVWFPYKPTIGRFTYLTTLELIEATSDFGQSIFDCPVLEKLALIICKGLFHTNFRAPNLKCLYQIYREIDLEISVAGLENLTEYSFMLLGGRLPTLPETNTSNVVKVLGSLHKIEKFSIRMQFIEYLAAGGCPNRLSKPLPYLKTLNMSGINFTHLSEVSCLLCLIRSAPNLCKLNIWGKYFVEVVEVVEAVEGDLKNYRIEDSEDCTTIDHLEIVTFNYFIGLKAELELVKFVLAHSPLLKTMFIHRDESIKRDVSLTMTEEILQYPRASTRAEIRHLKHNVEIDDIDDELWACRYLLMG